jgi:Ran GTPase-activating protein (RanGAP) involved in mRNA processing and transport
VRLKAVNIGWNGIGPEGGAAVADALMANQALLEIDISGNRLSLDTAKKMAAVLTTNDSIKVVKVSKKKKINKAEL